MLKTHCLYGHEYTPDNTYQYYKDGKPTSRRCKTCARAEAGRHRAANPSKVNDLKLKRLYGITYAQRDELLASQDHRCKACGRSDCVWGGGFKDKWHIDHDHDTGKVRGILCSDCNLILGVLKDNTEHMRQLISYLETT